MTWRRLIVACAFGSFAWPNGALAQATLARDASAAPAQPPGADASAPAPDAPACFPACRDGFTCHQGQCISLCNPACPAGLECVEGRRCEPPLPRGPSPARPYEPPPPREKTFTEYSHGLLGFHWGLPGNVDRDGRALDLDPTLGVMLRSDTPVAKYVLLGPQLQLGSWRPDTKPASDHSYFVDLDLVIRLRAPITTDRFNYQLWVGMPVGVSIDIPPSSEQNLGLGWNIGVLFGGAVHFTSKFGLFAEIGWEQHRLTHSQDNLPDLDLKLQQPLSNIGIVVRN